MENSNTKVIGFAREYYTLWQMVTIPKYENIEGSRTHVGTEYNYNYIQNLSKDLDKAIDKVEKSWGVKDPEVDESLRGVTTRSFSRYEHRALPFDVFPYGKLKYTPIMDSNDVWQLQRVYDGEGSVGGDKEFETSIPTRRRVLARRRLIQLEELTKVEGKWLTKREIEHNKKIVESVWMHNDGERVELKLLIVSEKHYNTDFGLTSIITYNSENGDVYVYKGSNPPYVEDKDKFFNAKATIKHSEYKQVKQTLIQRVKVL